MVERKLLNTEVYVFIIVVLISIVIFTLYRLVRPELDLPYNFTPFPNVSPKDLPDAQTSGGSCSRKLTPCDELGKCSTCGEQDYECVNVTDPNRFVINNINVPVGNWCLPKQNPTQSCNEYTGRWTWVTDPDYCPAVNDGKNQCWKCLCLYPDLFDGTETGCTTQKACKNTSAILSRLSNQDQSKNVLVGVKGSIYENQVWDPTGADTKVLLANPYSVDDTGKPMFECKCGGNDDVSFAKLPNDPYSCHLDACFKNTSYNHSGAVCDDDNCTCTCGVSGTFIVPKSIGGDFSGTCVFETDVCGTTGTWDPSTSKCNCPTGIPEDCTSDHVPGSTGPQCPTPTNPVGKTCVDPCSAQPCQNKGTCTIPVGGVCPGGSVGCSSSPNACCMCAIDGDYQYNGDCCEDKCIRDQVNYKTDFSGTGGDSSQIWVTGTCCNGSYVKTSGYSEIITDYYCGTRP
jgi:hypothetical protein